MVMKQALPVMGGIMQELHTQRVTALADITPALVRDVVRRRVKAYDHVSRFVSRLLPQAHLQPRPSRSAPRSSRMDPAFDRR